MKCPRGISKFVQKFHEVIVTSCPVLAQFPGQSHIGKNMVDRSMEKIMGKVLTDATFVYLQVQR